MRRRAVRLDVQGRARSYRYYRLQYPPVICTGLLRIVESLHTSGDPARCFASRRRSHIWTRRRQTLPFSAGVEHPLQASRILLTELHALLG